MDLDFACRELAANGAAVRSLASGLSPDEARWRPGPGAWSVLEVVCHLHDEEREDFRQRLDFILHRPAEPWPPIDPRGWVTARGYNERGLPEMLAAFEGERQKSLDWLRSLGAPNLEAAVPAPWGTIQAGEMLAAWVAHDTLHLRQLVELRRARVERLTQPYSVIYAGEW